MIVKCSSYDSYPLKTYANTTSFSKNNWTNRTFHDFFSFKRFLKGLISLFWRWCWRFYVYKSFGHSIYKRKSHRIRIVNFVEGELLFITDIFISSKQNKLRDAKVSVNYLEFFLIWNNFQQKILVAPIIFHVFWKGAAGACCGYCDSLFWQSKNKILSIFLP